MIQETGRPKKTYFHYATLTSTMFSKLLPLHPVLMYSTFQQSASRIVNQKSLDYSVASINLLAETAAIVVSQVMLNRSVAEDASAVTTSVCLFLSVHQLQ